jgi:heat shock protein HslJ
MRRMAGYLFMPAALLAAALLLSAGCLTPAGERPPAGGTGAGTLEGTAWDLVSYKDVNGTMTGVIPGTRVTAVFSPGGKMGGTAGCNHYFGEYTVDRSSLTMKGFGSTLMACLAPGVMEQESRYLALLGSATGFRIDGDRLTLADATGTGILVFEREKPPAPLPLTGTNWTLESISTGSGGISSVLAGTGIDATFSDDGKVTGSAGCNRYFADYTLNGTSLRFGHVGATKMYCGDPAGLMQQEQTYLARLGSVESYRIEASRLVLMDGSGSLVLSYRAV